MKLFATLLLVLSFSASADTTDIRTFLYSGTTDSVSLNLSTEKKELLRENGKEYALTCSWKNRAEEWSSMLGLNKKRWIFYCSPHFETKMIQQ